jgi:hypothetical protein
MKADFEFNWSQFSRALNDFAEKTGVDTTKLLRDEAGRLAKQLALITPPFPNKGAGLNAVKRDIRKVYAPLTEAYESIQKINPNLAAAFWRYLKQGEENKAKKLALQVLGNRVLTSIDTNLHQQRRDNYGRVKGDRPSAYVDKTSSITKYIRDMQKHVGSAKAPYGMVAKHYGQNLPGWMTDHSSPYEIIDRADAKTNNEKFIEFSNKLPWADNIKGWHASYQNAINTRAQNLQKSLERIMRERCKYWLLFKG